MPEEPKEPNAGAVRALGDEILVCARCHDGILFERCDGRRACPRCGGVTRTGGLRYVKAADPAPAQGLDEGGRNAAA